MITGMNFSQCDNYPSTTSNYRSDIEVPYTQYNRSSSLSPSPSISLQNVWSKDTEQEHEGHHDGTYRRVHKDSRALKVVTSHNRHLQYASSDFNHAQPYHGSRPTHRSSPYETPRSNRLIDRMKADLKSPRSTTTTPNNDNAKAFSHIPQHPDSNTLHDSPQYQILPPPTLYGVRCTEVSQKAYSGQSSQMKKGFEMLQRLDNGKVEYRTIAFCTHLTVSRWEPTTLPPTNDTSSSQVAPNTQGHAVRLMSLANYIRHILSLTVAVPNSQSLTSSKQQQQQQQPTKEDTRNTNATNSNSSLNSSGLGPIKTDSNRRHRYSAYQNHSGRRNPQSSEVSLRDHSLQLEGRNDVREISLSSQDSMGLSYPPQSSQAQNKARDSTPLLKIPFPNLTLTLALIYVDRLKAKYPDAKGEPGCSHRLFLVAFIIAAKYRCSVELSSPLHDSDHDPNGENSELNDTTEARLNKELVFSNHAWVRLLNLGSFYRQPPTTPTSGVSTENQDQNPCAEPTRAQSIVPQESPNSLPSIINATSAPMTGMLQVEDLDRMEAEFLTFLNFDLATMGQDLGTCWNLLVGKTQASSSSE